MSLLAFSPRVIALTLNTAIPSINPHNTTRITDPPGIDALGYVITITNYLATTASHFTQINKSYPLDKDGGRAGVTHYAHAVGSALRTLRALRRKHETRNAVAARIPVDQSPARRPARPPTHSPRVSTRHTCVVSRIRSHCRLLRTRGNGGNLSALYPYVYARMTYALNSIRHTVKLARMRVFVQFGCVGGWRSQNSTRSYVRATAT